MGGGRRRAPVGWAGALTVGRGLGVGLGGLLVAGGRGGGRLLLLVDGRRLLHRLAALPARIGLLAPGHLGPRDWRLLRPVAAVHGLRARAARDGLLERVLDGLLGLGPVDAQRPHQGHERHAERHGLEAGHGNALPLGLFRLLVVTYGAAWADYGAPRDTASGLKMASKMFGGQLLFEPQIGQDCAK